MASLGHSARHRSTAYDVLDLHDMAQLVQLGIAAYQRDQ